MDYYIKENVDNVLRMIDDQLNIKKSEQKYLKNEQKNVKILKINDLSDNINNLNKLNNELTYAYDNFNKEVKEIRKVL